jgi:hypothetical protein
VRHLRDPLDDEGAMGIKYGLYGDRPSCQARPSRSLAAAVTTSPLTRPQY